MKRFAIHFLKRFLIYSFFVYFFIIPLGKLSLLKEQAFAQSWSEEIQTGTPIRAHHFRELQKNLYNKRKQCFNIANPRYSWTTEESSILPNVAIRASHIDSIRTAIKELYLAAPARPVPPFIDSTIVPGVTEIKALHFRELRSAIQTSTFCGDTICQSAYGENNSNCKKDCLCSYPLGWQDIGCGMTGTTVDCEVYEMYRTRTPDVITATCIVAEQCEINYPACCAYGAWQNVGCGEGGCGPTGMLRKQDSAITDCPPLYDCQENGCCNYNDVTPYCGDPTGTITGSVQSDNTYIVVYENPTTGGCPTPYVYVEANPSPVTFCGADYPPSGLPAVDPFSGSAWDALASWGNLDLVTIKYSISGNCAAVISVSPNHADCVSADWCSVTVQGQPCCQNSDPCSWEDDCVCDCSGECSWDTADCSGSCSASPTPTPVPTPTPSGSPCVAQDCPTLGHDCGDQTDNCGDYLDCGSCGSGDICFAGNCIACTPDCSGKDCGDDDCGGSCGSCQADESCISDQCVFTGCIAESCGDLGYDCGDQTDNCGDYLDCGGCPSGETCVSAECEIVDECVPSSTEDCDGGCGSGSGTRVCTDGQWGSCTLDTDLTGQPEGSLCTYDPGPPEVMGMEFYSDACGTATTCVSN